MKRLIIPILLMFLAGLCDGVMDLVSFHYYNAPGWMDPSFWEPTQSWLNKWATDSDGLPLPGTERFWGSSTVFVFLTDGWHLMKAIKHLLISGALAAALSYDLKRRALVGALIQALILAVFYVGFEIFYK